jgi:hypothetical protein
MTTTPAETNDPAKKPAKAAKPPRPKRVLFPGDAIKVDVVDDRVESARVKRVVRIIKLQMTAIVTLVLVLLGGVPFFQPIYHYYALSSSRQTMGLVPLIMPNMTNQAVLSWATNSITEIMTFGFGDYQTHLRDQQMRFTPRGWEKFVSAFDKMKIGEAFRQRQLVLTTVPSNIATITSQGENLKHVYEWHVEMPVIMTYTTNDNVNRHDEAKILLTITRVPSSDNPAGIAIESWVLG